MAKPEKYSIEGLKHGIERARINIQSLKKAIADERALIAQYEKHIRDLEWAKKMANPEIHVEVEVE